MNRWLLRDAKTRRILAWRVRRARGLLERTVGLLPRTNVAPQEGLWFDRCSAVHTLGMRTPLDIVFFDAAGCVVRIAESVPPQRFYVGARGACTVAEFGPGFARTAGIRAGDRVLFEAL